MTKTKCELKYLKKTAQLGHMLRKKWSRSTKRIYKWNKTNVDTYRIHSRKENKNRCMHNRGGAYYASEKGEKWDQKWKI
jgi:hypothetical protein